MPAPLQIPGELVARLRKQRQWTAAQLAELVGTTQQTINKIEMGNIKYSKYFVGIKEALGITDEMVASYQPATLVPAELAPLVLETDPSLPLRVTLGRVNHNTYRLINCPVCKVQRPPMLKGSNGAYAILMPDDSVAPKYSAGDTLLVNPGVPPRPGNYHVFLDDNGNYQVRRLLAITKDYYSVTAVGNNHNEASDRVPTSWDAHLIVGSYLDYEP